MIILIISLLIIGVIAAAATLLGHRSEVTPINAEPSCSTCTGSDARCEQECMMEAATRDIEYFDDEELDRFADRPSDSYTDNEVEEFAEVLYTLQPGEEVKAWSRSLILRHINLPDRLKDEFIALTEN